MLELALRSGLRHAPLPARQW